MLIFDGHLDLAMNALAHERDQTLPVEQLRRREAGGVRDGRGRCGVSLDAMRQGGVRLCVATVLARAKPWVDAGREIKRDNDDWPSRDMAHAIAAGHLAYYRLLERQGLVRIITTGKQLADFAAQHAQTDCPSTPSARPTGGMIGIVLTMEGADPVTRPDELGWWQAQGVSTLMLAHFGRSHYAHGTPSCDASNTHDVDGPLTGEGRALLDEMARLGMPLDLSHLSDASLAEAVGHFSGAIYASHSSCRALVPGGEGVHPMRMLTDAQIRSIGERGGVIGLPLFNAFLRTAYKPDSRKEDVSLDDVVDHVDHICQVTGGVRHAAIGSDLDGGFGVEHVPAELDTIADLPRIAERLASRGYADEDVRLVLGGNWLKFFEEALPDR